MKIKALSLLIAICLVIGMIPAAAAAAYPVLSFQGELTLSCSPDHYTYVSFTPAVTGDYRFYSTGSIDTKATFCTGDMIHMDESSACYTYSHEEAWTENFCFTLEDLEAGVTYLLGVRIESGDAADVTIHSACSHNMTREYLEEPVCNERARYQAVCSQCGYTTTDEEYVYHEYEYTLVKEGTCVEEGLERRTCIKCGLTREETFSGDHDIVYEEVQAPTCTLMGVMSGVCSLCGEADGYSTYMLDHEYDETLKCIHCGNQAQTSGSWEQLSWSFADGVLTITGEGAMPYVGYGEDWYGNIVRDDLPWDVLPVTRLVVGSGITNVPNTLMLNIETLETVELPDTITAIGEFAFLDCSTLETVALPEGLTEIGYGAFWGCGLREVLLPASLEDGVSAFEGNDRMERMSAAPGNPRYASDDQGVLYSKDMTTLEYFPAAFAGPYVMPASVTAISDTVSFYDADGLTGVRVEEGNPSFASDDQGVLYDAELTRILFFPAYVEGTYVLPATVSDVTDAWFWTSEGLEAFEVAEGNREFYALDGVLYEIACFEDTEEFLSHTLISCPPAKQAGKLAIADGATGVDWYAFVGCTGLTELVLPASCGELPIRSCFQGCTNLQAIWVEEGNQVYISDAEGVLFNAKPRNVNLSSIQHAPGKVLEYVPCGRTGYYAIPEGVTGTAYASMSGTQLSAIRYPSTLTVLGNESLVDDVNVEWILFAGDRPYVAFQGEGWAANVTAKLYYPGWMEGWKKEVRLDEDLSDITYIPYEQGKAPVWGGEGNPFTDVPADSFYCESVLWAVENGITNGLSADTFGPAATCNRAQVVTFLWRAAGSPEPKTTTHDFVDVAPGSFYEKPVLWALENGITTGSDSTHFGPTLDCNRAQVVTFLYRAFKSPAVSVEGLPFADVPAGSWYEAPIAWAVANNITNGLDATHFGPTSICNRAQVVTFLHRAYVK